MDFLVDTEQRLETVQVFLRTLTNLKQMSGDDVTVTFFQQYFAPSDVASQSMRAMMDGMFAPNDEKKEPEFVATRNPATEEMWSLPTMLSRLTR
jgi:hypothetical protein